MPPRVLAIANDQSANSARARLLIAHLPFLADYFERDRTVSARQTARLVWNLLQKHRWDLVYVEGTGVPVGGPLILASKRFGQRYIVSSGDPVGGFFHTTRGPLFGWTMERYERSLYRNSAGFVGWTPYLTGMAQKMGAPRGCTVEGGADLARFRPLDRVSRQAARARFGVPPDSLVCGVVGSLVWTKRQSYSYGLELIETLRHLKRKDVSMLIVGDGDARRILEDRIPASLRDRVHFTGRLEGGDLIEAMNAMDIGFITQTLDSLGSYRLTTKLPEYLACGLPVAMSPIPGYYDYCAEAGWALPAQHPASEGFHRGCAAWLDKLTPEDLANKTAHARPLAEQRFDYRMLGARFANFVTDLLH